MHLAYASGHRERISDAAARAAIYTGSNLQLEAAFTVDGRVAGLVTVRRAGRRVAVTLRPTRTVRAADRRLVEAESEALLEALHEDARQRSVAWEAG